MGTILQTPYTLGLDIGTNSIGWSLVGEDKIIALGVRIFSDGREPKSGNSLAVDRRVARAMRRRRDRYLRRRTRLLELLIEYGLMPLDKAERRALAGSDPYALRARALSAPLTPFEIGRALFHLNQRRGFKSNRKTDRNDAEEGLIASGVSKLRAAMIEGGYPTFGAFLAARLAQGLPVRVRLNDAAANSEEAGAGKAYAFYPDRQLLEDEFNAIWRAQAPHHPVLLTDERRSHLHTVVFYQRPLKAPEVGLCTLLGPETGERRLAKSDPLFQQRRLLEELNSLTIERGPGVPAERLTREQRDKLLLALKGKKAAAFTSLRRTLKLGDAVFNKERAGRDKLLGDEVAAELASEKRWGPGWHDLLLERQREIAARLRESQDTGELVRWLISACDLDEARAQAVASARLPEGYGRFGETATRALIRELTTYEVDGRVCVYSEAVRHAPELGHHSDFRTGEVHDRLPYYGVILERHVIPGTGDPADAEDVRIGKVTNPTVHIGLNQLRRVVNAILARYGPPQNVIVEIARDLKKTPEQVREIEGRQKKERLAAERRSAKLIELGQQDTGANRALLKLWEDLNPADPLDRRCIYSGEVISPAMLFSGAVDVDHILPWSRTLDDSPANKIVCLAEKNREKRNRTPFEAWSASPDWEGIVERAARLPREKAWRFGPDAMNRFDSAGGFLARHLVDTQYLSTLARTYLEAVAPDRVYVSTGHLTGMLRRHWGLNSLLPDHNYSQTVHEKNRLDHRHHAIDAAVVGCLTLGLIQRISRESGRREADALSDVIGRISPPWETFRDELGKKLAQVVVSHKPDHGTVGAAKDKGKGQTAGRLHNDTAYGLTGLSDARGNRLVVRRVALSALKPSHLEDNGARIRDDEIRLAMVDHTQGLDGKAFTDAILAFSRTHPKFKGIRRVRVIEPLAVIPITDESGKPFKGYKGDANYRFDVWELPGGIWKAEVISLFDAHSGMFASAIKANHPTARKVLRLHQGDLVAYDDEVFGSGIGRVVKFGQRGDIYFAPHNEAGALKARDATPKDIDPFKYFSAGASRLKKSNVRQVRVDELGRVWDPLKRITS